MVYESQEPNDTTILEIKNFTGKCVAESMKTVSNAVLIVVTRKS